ncbi:MULTISPECIES: septal ring lytic transglycosylase RlpA family protein [unclassified Aureispira]|uniref:septal ring lytic transglycosylase RlpA family protein n=1 Tax=unclassified Aureispira TaxID=2649989 RepID=UPI000698BF55|nr:MULTISPECIES: septal ring lytic transglycosylase RlpA family protein [unclassified Aureispira]WMX15829.1 septal ring lytic transglycosylase RlpA family protein [Aureispira sp. CCB-E]
MKLLVQIFALVILTIQVATATPVEKGLASYYDDSFHGRKTASGEKYDKNQLTAAHKTLPFGTKVKVKNPANGKSVNVVINDRGPYIKGRVIEISKKAAQQIDLVKVNVAPVEITVISGPDNKPTVAAKSTNEKPVAKPVQNTTKATAKPAEKKKASTTQKEPKKDNLIVEAKEMETGGLYKMQVLKLQPKGFGVQVAGYSDYQSVVQQLAVFQKNWFKGATVFVDKLNGKPYYKIILGPMNTREEADSYCENLKKKYNLKDAFVVNIEALAAKK